MVALLAATVPQSTTVRSIVGLVQQRSGRITFEGRNISTEPTHAISARWARLRAGRAAHLHGPDGRGKSRGRTPAEAAERARWNLRLRASNLGDTRANRRPHEHGGEQQMLTIARTLMGNPYSCWTSPAEGLSPKYVEQMVDAILAMKEGVSIVVSEQNLHFARLISDRASSSNAQEAARWPNSTRGRTSATRICRCDPAASNRGRGSADGKECFAETKRKTSAAHPTFSTSRSASSCARSGSATPRSSPARSAST